MLVKPDSYRYINEIRTFPNTIYKNKILSLLQGIFPSQGLNPGLPHCRQILYQLSHKGNPRILERIAEPFSSRSSDPGIKSESPALQAVSLSTELSRKPPNKIKII